MAARHRERPSWAARESSCSSEPSIGRNDPTDHEWTWCREKITWLYWEQNLPVQQVQEIMRREHGLEATQKMYKSRFRKWGLRKNLRSYEAREIVSGQAKKAQDFWPDSRRREYERRIARHLGRHGRKHPRGQQDHPGPRGRSLVRQQQVSVVPARLKAPGNLETLEKSIYDVDVYMHFTMDPNKTWLANRAELGEHDQFFPLFIGGLENLSRDLEPQKAFADIGEAFDHLRALVSFDDPAVYHRLVARFSSFKQYPSSEICFKVCCLLIRYLSALYRELHGPSHPLDGVWPSHIDVLESRQGSDFFERYLESYRALGAKLYASSNCLDIGALDLSKYIPSRVREWDEEALQRGLAETLSQPALLPGAQEIRLALAELLLQQKRSEEGASCLSEAVSLRHVDVEPDAIRVFWMAELEWRAGNPADCVMLLKESFELAESQGLPTELVGTEKCGLSKLSILHTLIFRLNVLNRQHEMEQAWARMAPLVAALRHRKPLTLHLTSSDFELDIDTRFAAMTLEDKDGQKSSSTTATGSGFVVSEEE
ncbi:hypothetical protein J7T55_014249 [Diaporthe amygdali]|uniref:uncharacterized protein n=1 Tax=Phomopsis amygdali TaxID=1214568 RepID=UPI0022FEE6EE|nr:uncharacterized protein J7T55_014249 [Diaporthe amygdali]KAJ0109687.1 hypothetical protein J7T55_014249 [Diaporthe amygdali]